jgi:alpha-acetolactate decarboxylase
VDGVFDTIHARAVHPVPQGTRLLEAAQTELEFHFDNIEGTLVTDPPAVDRDFDIAS